ncbi:T9SS type A sorting domain-containing protein [Pinibacter aurantiacus]|uniref:T9SS type A sorting domain-containing protein n=1 Tax=Pinibacter aurantiacus TaxID=2851599 RepID=A0A9E2W8X3_9BACT|nr:T9SS type A sorting domain-containing protein [Pinibacter aurantiacus]MBV4358832.1 T9SS type A sorting domain-containing protein [Pinibacter aurantiacus]
MRLSLTLLVLYFTSQLLEAQTIVDGSFEHCASSGPVVASADQVQTLRFTPCGSPATLQGGGLVFFSNGNQGTSYNAQVPCFYYSPAPTDGVRNVGMGNDVLLTVPLTSSLTPGASYTLTFDLLNTPGDDGTGKCPDNISMAGLEIGVSSSATSFGSSVGTSSLLAPSNTYAYSTLNFPFVAPSGDNSYITLRLSNQANDTSILFIDKMSLSITPLPLTLMSFSGSANRNCSTILNWQTTAEINVNHFSILYSKDGSTFKPIGTVPASGGSDVKDYSYDNSQRDTRGYYKLQMVDNDGTTTYSKTISILSICGDKTIVVTPNPVGTNGTLNIMLDDTYRNVSGVLYDNAGRAVKRFPLNEKQNFVSLSNVATGIYLLAIINNETKMVSYRKIYVNDAN